MTPELVVFCEGRCWRISSTSARPCLAASSGLKVSGGGATCFCATAVRVKAQISSSAPPAAKCSFRMQRQRQQLRNVPHEMDLEPLADFLGHFQPVRFVL